MALPQTILYLSSSGTPLKLLSITFSECGEVRLLVREVRAPDRVVDADPVTQLHAGRVVLEAPEDVAAHVIAGLAVRQRLEAQEVLRPV